MWCVTIHLLIIGVLIAGRNRTLVEFYSLEESKFRVV